MDLVSKLLALPKTDLGNAQALQLLYGKEIRFCSAKNAWLVWTGDHWAENEGGHIRNLIRRSGPERYALFKEAGIDGDLKASLYNWLMGCENERRVSTTLASARDMDALRIAETQLDASIWDLGLKDGQLDLGTGKLVSPNPFSYITRRMATPFVAGADCPKWKKFLNEIFSGDQELIQFIQLAVGYCLTGSVKEQVMFVCVGEGANGKSTFLGTLYKLFGDYAGSTPFSTFDAKSRSEATNDLARLKGKRFVTIMETDEDSFLAEQKIKQATGEDPITCRFHYQEFFEYIPQFKIWLAANRIPGIKGVDYGIKRRLVIIPFKAQFEGSQRDDSLGKRLLEELPGILNWAIEGLELWKQHTLYRSIPQNCLDITQEYADDVDHLGNWIRECLDIGDSNKAQEEPKEKAIDLYRCYRMWMDERNHRPKSLTSWGRDMKSKEFEKRREQSGVVYIGVRLRPEALMGN